MSPAVVRCGQTTVPLLTWKKRKKKSEKPVTVFILSQKSEKPVTVCILSQNRRIGEDVMQAWGSAGSSLRSDFWECGRLHRPVTVQLVQLSALTKWVVGGTWEMIQQRSSSGLFCGRLVWAVLLHRQGCPLFDVVHPAFPLPTTSASPTDMYV